jgi:tetratricopeptide (TPR) repeat protein
MRTTLKMLALALGVGAVLALGCRQQGEPQAGGSSPADRGNAAADPKSEAERQTAFLAAHFKGLGHMERYEYPQAAAAFREALKLRPDLNATKVNLALALLNHSGEETEEAKKKPGAAPTAANFDEPLGLLDDVLAREPDNLHAHYARGLIRESVGEMDAASKDFAFVTERDPADAHAWYKLGSTLAPPAGARADSPEYADVTHRQVEAFTKALELNPYLVSAMYRLQLSYGVLGATTARKDAEQLAALGRQRQELMKRFEQLNTAKNPEAHGEAIDVPYGDQGRYALVIDPFRAREAGRAATVRPPRFEAPKPLDVALPEGVRWVRADDFQGPLAVVGRARERFGAAVAHLDADGDGRLDVYLAAAVKTPDGVRDALLLNRGAGRFEDASAAFGLPADRASLGVGAADFDADGRVDLYLTGVGGDLLLRNRDGKSFEDVTASLGDPGPQTINLAARWLDIDQDGDLDLYVIRYCSAENAERAFGEGPPPPGMPNAAYRNDGRPAPQEGPQNTWAPTATDFYRKASEGLSIAWTRWEGPEAEALLGGDAPHTGLALIDLDADRDLDLVLTADGVAPVAAINDRLGRFRARTLDDLDPKGLVSGAVVLDLDRDGRADLVLVRPDDRLTAWRNEPAGGGSTPPDFAFKYWPIDVRRWRSAWAFDVDFDGWTDLLGLPVAGSSDMPIAWARNEGSRLAPVPLPLMPDSGTALDGLDVGDLAGDPRPDLLLVRDGAGPSLAVALGNDHHWLGLNLSGRWKVGKGPDGGPARSNPQGIGTRVFVQGPGLDVSYNHGPIGSGPAQSAGPAVLGLGSSPEALLVRLTWPDGVMQSELNLPADQVLKLDEFNRKTGSCPVLFTFDGARFVCIGDFLGGGGLGYLVAPGEYGVPDRDEAVAIRGDQLRAVDGVFRMAVTEPMDEVAYLDKITLEVVDRPPGVVVTPDERFAPGGNRPTGNLLAWRTQIEPVLATDQDGRDVTDLLRAFDRRTVDSFRRLRDWTGYAEEHAIVLDFGDRLARFGPADRLVLGLAGWVEYPYSQTNYAAATAGVALRPPVLERRRDDGTWEVIEPDPGYPAGLPRLTTLELTGKLSGPRCVLRLRTNMECYWDQAFVAVLAPEPGLRVTELPVAKAALGYRGYTREVSPDGRPPLLYDYAYVDPAPLARLAGTLTRYGDVAPLLRDDDDQLCVVGPGDEVKLEFEASDVPPLLEGWARSYVLRSIGYCKDADPFTAGSDTVGPLPWKGMPESYPFGPEHDRPRDDAYDAYLRTYQTRTIRPR